MVELCVEWGHEWKINELEWGHGRCDTRAHSLDAMGMNGTNGTNGMNGNAPLKHCEWEYATQGV